MNTSQNRIDLTFSTAFPMNVLDKGKLKNKQPQSNKHITPQSAVTS